MASTDIEILDHVASAEKLNKIADRRALNRRHFLAALGMTGAAAGAGLMSGCSQSAVVPANTSLASSQTDILNFALNFKYLEATFYSYVVTGKDLTGTAVTNTGAITGTPASQPTFASQKITDLLNEILFDEKSHLNSLISLLGSSAVYRPAINLAAYAAITYTNALSIARLIEDVGATALATVIDGLDTTSATFMAQMLGAESFHAGALRLISIQNPSIAAYAKADSLDVAPFDPGTAALAAVGPVANGGFFATAGSLSFTLADPAGAAFARSTSQVLAIGYGTGGTIAASGTTSGGFFPAGVNGSINKV